MKITSKYHFTKAERRQLLSMIGRGVETAGTRTKIYEVTKAARWHDLKIATIESDDPNGLVVRTRVGRIII